MATSKKVVKKTLTEKESKSYFLLEDNSVLYREIPYSLEELKLEIQELVDSGDYNKNTIEDCFRVIDCTLNKVKNITLSTDIKIV
jgi:hypothetical protein